MAYLFRAPPEFFASSYVPQVCLLFGTERNLRYFAVSLALLYKRPGSNADDTIPVRFALSPAGDRFWKLLRKSQQTLVIAFVVALVAKSYFQPSDDIDSYTPLIAGFVGLMMAAGLLSYLWLPKIEMDEQAYLVQIRFSPATRKVYHLYCGAFMRWKADTLAETDITYEVTQEGWE